MKTSCAEIVRMRIGCQNGAHGNMLNLCKLTVTLFSVFYLFQFAVVIDLKEKKAMSNMGAPSLPASPVNITFLS